MIQRNKREFEVVNTLYLYVFLSQDRNRGANHFLLRFMIGAGIIRGRGGDFFQGACVLRSSKDAISGFFPCI